MLLIKNLATCKPVYLQLYQITEGFAQMVIRGPQSQLVPGERMCYTASLSFVSPSPIGSDKFIREFCENSCFLINYSHASAIFVMRLNSVMAKGVLASKCHSDSRKLWTKCMLHQTRVVVHRYCNSDARAQGKYALPWPLSETRSSRIHRPSIFSLETQRPSSGRGLCCITASSYASIE